MGEVIDFPVPEELTPHQIAHWEYTLEVAERQRLYALRMLGRLPTEQEVEG